MFPHIIDITDIIIPIYLTLYFPHTFLLPYSHISYYCNQGRKNGIVYKHGRFSYFEVFTEIGLQCQYPVKGRFQKAKQKS